MKIKLTLDRFEGDFGICLDEDGKSYDVPKAVLCGISENDIFLAEIDSDSFSNIELLADETAERKERIRARLNKILAKSGKKEGN